MKSAHAQALTAFLALSSGTFAAPTQRTNAKRDLRFGYGTDKVRGVNLGGWFVLEPWITPSIFQEWATSQTVVDEYTLTQTLGSEEATSRLTQHWNTWITQDDFTQIAKLGLNHVRIPIGYWSVTPLSGDPYVQGAYDVLGQSLDWAQAAGLKVMIDLHGAPGSQNGFDNSGRKGAIDWTQGNTVNQTLDALQKIAQDHGAHPAVATIELLNEPMGPQLDDNVIQQFFYDGYGRVSSAAPDVAVTFHDAFLGQDYWNSFGSGLQGLVEDTHHYEVFDAGQLALSPSGHVSSACGFGKSMAAADKTVISGEWTGAQTDCAQWLNGLGVGARYDGTYNVGGQGSSYIGDCARKSVGTVDGLSDDEKTNIRQFNEAQLDAYELAGGWIWWTWKTESAPEWDLQNQTAAGLFPQPLSDRQYPGQCG